MKSELSDRTTLAAFIAVVLLGGLNGVGIRFLVSELPPFWAAVLRFLPAALILFVISFLFRLRLPTGQSLLGAVIFGVLNFGASFGLVFWGLQQVPAGMGQVIGALVPLLTLVFAVLHRQESFHWRSFLGSLLAVAGVAIVFTQQMRADVPFAYLLAILIAAVCNAEAAVLVKKYPITHPIPTSAVSQAAGALVLFLISLLVAEPHPLPQLSVTWITLGYMVLVGSCLLFILGFFVLKRWRATTTSYLFVLLPFVTITASAFLDNERLSLALIAGAVLVLVGVYIGALSQAGESASVTPTSHQAEPLAIEPVESSD